MSAASRQFSSWKEIAHFLGVNIRTAQKWEQERGLPVRRTAGPRGRVSAEVASLEVWKQTVAHAPKNDDRCYRWPLGPSLTVEVRFIGTEIGSTHIDLLREYLDLFRTALK